MRKFHITLHHNIQKIVQKVERKHIETIRNISLSRISIFYRSMESTIQASKVLSVISEALKV